jgi:hypothetical protein
VVIHYFDVVRAVIRPGKADAPLEVNPYAVLPGSVAGEWFQAIAPLKRQVKQ